MNPRTASRATAEWLRNNIPWSLEPQCSTHAGIDILKKKCPDVNLEEYSTFQTVRHPCDLLTSHYYGNVCKCKWQTMWDWLKDGAPAAELLVGGTLYWRFPETHVFKFEYLQEITTYFCNRYECTAVRPMLHNPYHKTKNRKDQKWQDIWTPQMLNWAEKNLEHDLTKYNYEVR